jgi:hypothetical protein
MADAPPAAAGAASAAAAGSSAEAADEIAEPRGGAAISPVELIPRIELRQSYLRLNNGITIDDATAEIDIQFLHRVLLQYVTPLRVMKTPTGQIAGLGDVQLQAVALLGATPRYIGAAIVGAIVDTASQPQLGAGKQQLLLGGGAAWKPRLWWLLYGLAQEQLSVGGDSNRPDVNQLFLRVGNVIFGKGFSWYKMDLDTTVDFRSSAGRFFGALEVGTLLVDRVGLFARAGTQLLGQRQVDYSLSGGVRYLFRLPYGK